MGNIAHIDPPFGTFALPPRREKIRLGAARFTNTKPGRWGISLARKRSINGLNEPFDVTVSEGVNARLYPSTNRCEKRALAGVQVWDAIEREALRLAISVHSELPFVFLDVGANVGLYTLFAHAYAKQVNREIQLIAIEPSSDIGARLRVNAAASGANVQLVQAAISTQAGEVFLSDGNGNRGEGKLSETGESVSSMTLLQLCRQVKLDRIDALKLDIEGVDLPVLTQFFEESSKRLHPRTMILEFSADSAEALIVLVKTHNYLIVHRTHMNVVVTKRDR